MRINLKSDRTGLFRTVKCVHIQTLVYMGSFQQSEHDKQSKDSIDYQKVMPDNSFLRIHTYYDALVIEFSNAYIRVTTRNFGDGIGINAWRHIAHEVALILTGDTNAIHDVDNAKKIVKQYGLNKFSDTVIEHINKLVTIQKGCDEMDDAA